MKMEQEEKKGLQMKKPLSRLPMNRDKQLMNIPGIYFGGGCSYMACRGLMMGPISDVLLITHGPTGCGCFAGINGPRERSETVHFSYEGRCFSTDMRESDIVFGGEQKLLAAISEAVELFHPKAIAVCTTCPIGLIGDDIEQIAKQAEKAYGIPVLPLSCEGFKSSVNGGWMLGGRMLFERWMGTKKKTHGSFPVHFMSESYYGADKEAIDGLFTRIGYDVVCSLMGSTTYEAIASGQSARLIVLDTGKIIDPIPKAISEKYGAGFFRADFTGISNIVNSLRHMAAFFGDIGLTERTEQVIRNELGRIAAPWEAYRKKFAGMTAVLYEDIFRSDHFAALSSDLGMEIVMIAPDFYNESYSDEGFTLHIGTGRLAGNPIEATPLRREAGRVYFRLSRDQVSSFLRELRPDICFAGIEEQFGYGQAPIRSEQFTSEERGVQYGGFNGFLCYAKDLSMAAFMSHWVTRLPTWVKEGAV